MIYLDGKKTPSVAVRDALRTSGVGDAGMIAYFATARDPAKIVRIPKGRPGAGQFALTVKTPVPPKASDRTLADLLGLLQDMVAKSSPDVQSLRLQASDAAEDAGDMATAAVLRSPDPAVLFGGSAFSLEPGPQSFVVRFYGSGTLADPWSYIIDISYRGKVLEIKLPDVVRVRNVKHQEDAIKMTKVAFELYNYNNKHLDQTPHAVMSTDSFKGFQALVKRVAGRYGKVHDWSERFARPVDHSFAMNWHARHDDPSRRVSVAVPAGFVESDPAWKDFGLRWSASYTVVPPGKFAIADGASYLAPNRRVARLAAAQAEREGLLVRPPAFKDGKPLHVLRIIDLPIRWEDDAANVTDSIVRNGGTGIQRLDTTPLAFWGYAFPDAASLDRARAALGLRNRWAASSIPPG